MQPVLTFGLLLLGRLTSACLSIALYDTSEGETSFSRRLIGTLQLKFWCIVDAVSGPPEWEGVKDDYVDDKCRRLLYEGTNENQKKKG